jgi:hypothetical protein
MLSPNWDGPEHEVEEALPKLALFEECQEQQQELVE